MANQQTTIEISFEDYDRHLESRREVSFEDVDEALEDLMVNGRIPTDYERAQESLLNPNSDLYNFLRYLRKDIVFTNAQSTYELLDDVHQLGWLGDVEYLIIVECLESFDRDSDEFRPDADEIQLLSDFHHEIEAWKDHYFPTTL